MAKEKLKAEDKKPGTVVLQSWMPHPLTVVLGGAMVQIPFKADTPKNICFVPSDAWALVTDEDSVIPQQSKVSVRMCRELLQKKLIRVLDNVPSSYYSAAEMVGQKDAELSGAKDKIVTQEQEIAAKDAELAALRKQIESLGGRI